MILRIALSMHTLARQRYLQRTQYRIYRYAKWLDWTKDKQSLWWRHKMKVSGAKWITPLLFIWRWFTNVVLVKRRSAVWQWWHGFMGMPSELLTVMRPWTAEGISRTLLDPTRLKCQPLFMNGLQIMTIQIIMIRNMINTYRYVLQYNEDSGYYWMIATRFPYRKYSPNLQLTILQAYRYHN